MRFSDRRISTLLPSKKTGGLVGEYFEGRAFADSPSDIPCVNVERTFLEKLFLLHEEFQKPHASIRTDRLSRHLYDLEKIMESEYEKKRMNLPSSIVKIESTQRRDQSPELGS